MFNAGTGASQLWTFVGSIPVIDNIANLSGNEIEGDIRYCATNNKIYFCRYILGVGVDGSILTANLIKR